MTLESQIDPAEHTQRDAYAILSRELRPFWEQWYLDDTRREAMTELSEQLEEIMKQICARGLDTAGPRSYGLFHFMIGSSPSKEEKQQPDLPNQAFERYIRAISLEEQEQIGQEILEYYQTELNHSQ